MKRLLMVLMLVLALVAAACGANGSETGGGEEESTTTAPDGASAEPGSFGDLDGPVCGEGDFTVEADEAGAGTDALHIGVANDRSAEVRPGLNKVLYDASVAFASWCNEQGGIGGLPIEIIDMDAALFNVESVMTTACSDAFAMVGGGLVQDQLEFSGKDGSDFHKCAMIDIPAYAVSIDKTESNGQVQPVPNPGQSQANTWFRDFQELYPEDSANWMTVWGELPSLEIVSQKYVAAVEDVGGMDIKAPQSYPIAGVTDWTPYAQRLVGADVGSFTFVGEPDNLSAYLIKAREQGWDGTPLVETNMYDPKLFAAGDAAEGVVIRTQLHTFEERDKWPGIDQYMTLLEDYVDDGEVGTLGVQSMSAWLLFATAANACGEKNDGVLDRTCILTEAAAVDDWTGGGMHAVQDPAGYEDAKASPCGMLLVVEGGEFKRLYPEIDGDNDDQDGFHCPEDGVTEVEEDLGDGVVDPDRPI